MAIIFLNSEQANFIDSNMRALINDIPILISAIRDKNKIVVNACKIFLGYDINNVNEQQTVLSRFELVFSLIQTKYNRYYSFYYNPEQTLYFTFGFDNSKSLSVAYCLPNLYRRGVSNIIFCREFFMYSNKLIVKSALLHECLHNFCNFRNDYLLNNEVYAKKTIGKINYDLYDNNVLSGLAKIGFVMNLKNQGKERPIPFSAEECYIYGPLLPGNTEFVLASERRDVDFDFLRENSDSWASIYRYFFEHI